MMTVRCLLITLFLLTTQLVAADLDFYLGESQTYNPAVPTPESHLGYHVGKWHARHDQLLTYMYKLADASDRVLIQEIGKTHEDRPLVHLIISSPENLAKIDSLREQHVTMALEGKGDVASMPVVFNLGYGVHGNEPSGSNAALLVAYYLAAAEGAAAMLDNAIIILDPVLNPDGFSRFAHWANMHKGKNLVPDSIHREHREGWPSGRTNHYWFDLNRDWLLLVHPSSRARIERFHHWRPNILTDVHEMGTGSTYFFQPGIPSRQNPLTPDRNLELTRKIATYHAAALDEDGELYFTEQAFDDFYYGKGSTYPDAQGAIGILFEQASSRGHYQKNSYGDLTFPDTIKNQVTTSFSTIKAGLENRVELLTYQREFFTEAMKLAKDDKVKAYVFGSDDAARTHALVHLLRQHQIEVHKLAKSVTAGDVTLEQGYIVPVEQRQYRLVKSLFEPVTSFRDNTFYDVSTWHMPSAFWQEWAALDQRAFARDLMGERVEDAAFPARTFSGGEAYAYVIEWTDMFAPRAAYELMDQGVKIRFATEAFSIETDRGMREFAPGSLLIPTGIQADKADMIRQGLAKVAADDGVQVYAVQTGLTPTGVDFGSRSLAELVQPKPLLVVGDGVSAYEAGEIWHLLDVRMDMRVTMVEGSLLPRVNLDDYTHLIMVNGRYPSGDNLVDRIKDWVRSGGVLMATKGATRWVVDREMVKLDTRKRPEDKDPATHLPYADRNRLSAYQQINGAIFAAEYDATHPLTFGIDVDELAMFRNSTIMFEPSKNPYATVVRYTNTPLISGYVSAENLEALKGSAAVVAEGYGSGAIILMVDNPNFRGFWYGSNRLFMNGLYFGSSIFPSRRP